MQTTVDVRTWREHRILVAAGEAGSFPVLDPAGTAAVTEVLVTVVTAADGTLEPLRTSYAAVPAAGSPDGPVRPLTGRNLNRLPDDVRERVLAAAEGLGVRGLREDTATMLNGALRERRAAEQAAVARLGVA